jgi:hypothetical protein
MNIIERQLYGTFVSILIKVRKVSLLSNWSPKNLFSGTVFIGALYNFSFGSGRSSLLLQKYIQTISGLENLNPFAIAHFLSY